MRRTVLRGVWTIISVMMLVSCGSNSSPDRIVDNGGTYNGNGSLIGNNVFGEKDSTYLYNLFLTEYYWSNMVEKGIDTKQFTEAQTMINALKYTKMDKWSFAYTYKEYLDFSEQKNSGFGFGYLKDSADNTVIYKVLLSSPADNSGLKRGDILLQINGETVTDTLISETKNKLGIASVFLVKRGVDELNLTMVPVEYTFKVAAATTLQTPLGKKVGYLRFDSFTDTATDEIEQAFDYFSTQSINTLIIDMRYNGGGYLNTASIFLDKLVRNHDGLVQFRYVWNDAYSSLNDSVTFETDTNSINFSRVIFLTTGSTASASEMMINALHANALSVDVVTIGKTTHGKPVGMVGKLYNSFVYNLINFLVENADGNSDYFDGFAPTCEVEDDWTHEQGDPKESMLQQALTYIDQGSC